MRGFTLIEMIVAVGIFAMVSTLTVGSLLILTSAERHVSSVQINQDNVRFALESMSRDIRTGTDYSTSCGTGCFLFKNALGASTTYCRGKENPTGSGSYECDSDGTLFLRGAPSLSPIMSSDVTIEKLVFSLYGNLDTDPTNIAQPRVTVFISAVAAKDQKNETKMDIQTTVSQLMLDGQIAL